MQFHLYDYFNHFTIDENKEDDNRNLFIHESVFNESTALEYKGSKPLFIYEYKTPSDNDKAPSEEKEKSNLIHMEKQMGYHLCMEAKASILKFRLAWKAGITKYLDGTIHFPVWGHSSNTETRLITEGGLGMKEYDNSKYEEQMFYFNTVTRVSRYKHDILKNGIDYCYDCASEIQIIKKYLMNCRTGENPTSIPKLVNNIMDEIATHCSHGRVSKPNANKRRKLDNGQHKAIHTERSNEEISKNDF